MSVPPGKTTFTLPEAAELLSCHRETLRRAIRNGELRAAKLGRGFRISRSDLEAFWTASGGGDLFGREAESLAGPEAEKKPAPVRRGKPKNRQVQFSLPGTEVNSRAEPQSGGAGPQSGGTGPQGGASGPQGGASGPQGGASGPQGSGAGEHGGGTDGEDAG